ncbi:hypothetical protein DL96DRAFT_1810581 [Flagelloscypha sp. PMI_526]|nr:hypothetical protein DL96DRAFT_1810581 [Flagelloscypha sp. PMI_526]
MSHLDNPKDLKPLTVLSFDGSSNNMTALSELYILQDAAGRWASDSGLNLRSEEVCPSDMFDVIGGTGIGGFYAVLFAHLELIISQVIQASRVLEERLFASEGWSQRQPNASLDALNSSLDQIFAELEIETPLDSFFEDSIPLTKCVVCVLNSISGDTCHLLRNYRPRGSQSPQCTVRQVLQATFADRDHLPPISIQDEYFISALNGFANPTHVLMKELGNAFPKGSKVACVASIGAGRFVPQLLTNATNPSDPSAIVRLLQSSELVANEFASQCHELGAFYFRLSANLEVPQTGSLSQAYSQVKGMSMAYLQAQEATSKLDELVETLIDRRDVVSLERLGSLAGKDGQSQLVARVQEILQHLDDSIFCDINSWLQPIQQTSKLDSNIQVRGVATCQWILLDSTYEQWIEAKGGLFWYHGLMGTGKTVMSSFIIQSLLRRDDIRLAYYYFDTNPTTLSEEALFRSLLVQLAAAAPDVMRALHKKHNRGSLQPQLSTLQEALKDLMLASPKPVFIVIDAIDEVPPLQRKYLLQTLLVFCRSEFLEHSHIMVTSREDRDIHDAFNSRVDFQLAVQGSLVQKDIAAYIDQQLAAKKWSLWPRRDIELMRQILNERACSQFRMVACQVDILLQVKTSADMAKCLHSLPKTLASTYEYILDQIPDNLRSAARSLFAFLTFAYDDISINELSTLIVVEFGDDSNPDQPPIFQEDNCFHDPLDLLDLGGSFVTKTEFLGTGVSLQLAHASVKEYFLLDSGGWFALQQGPAQNLIAGACMAVLLHYQISPHDPNTTFLYSQKNWFKHIFPSGSRVLLSQQKAMFAFLQSLEDFGDSAHFPLVDAALWCLFDFINMLLSVETWDADALGSALVEAAGSPDRDGELAIKCCDLLLQHGASMKYLGEVGTPLHVAAVEENLEVAQFLVERGADVNAAGGPFGTPLQAAAQCASLEIVKLLVDNGAEVNRVEAGRTALQVATWPGSLVVVRFLVEKGADVNYVGEESPILCAAAWTGRLEVVELLLENGADVNAGGAGESPTALHAAVESGNLEIVQLLVEKGADINAVGRDNKTVLEAAEQWERWEIISFLEKGVQVGQNDTTDFDKHTVLV